ncbi:uncharacterized protein LOC143844011 [Paroedura picta]|uniref:uncharacterized protein LOC143844011 n=1 Tax=Paroedura picta TaxID=143630 RepID=UPI0040574462
MDRRKRQQTIEEMEKGRMDEERKIKVERLLARTKSHGSLIGLPAGTGGTRKPSKSELLKDESEQKGTRRRKKQSEASKKRRRSSRKSPSSGLLPSMPAVLIVGHSIPYWASRYAARSGWGTHLGLESSCRVIWSGHRGLRWHEVLRVVSDEVYRHGAPDFLLLHAGENDLPAMSGRCLGLNIKADLPVLHQRLPRTKLLWSDMLDRLSWRSAERPERVNWAKQKVNKVARKVVLGLGGDVIVHPDISFRLPPLFRRDGVHLSDWGCDLWLFDIRAGLCDNLFPEGWRERGSVAPVQWRMSAGKEPVWQGVPSAYGTPV